MKNLQTYADFINEGNLVTADDQAYLNQIIDYLKKNKYKTDKEFTKEILNVLQQRMNDREGLVKKRFQHIHKVVSDDFVKGKFISMTECKK